MHKRFAPALVALLCVAAGCGGTEEVSAEGLSALVLQPADVGGSLERFDEGAQVGADQRTGPRGDRTRFGRKEGWKARYRRLGSTSAVRGPLVVESRVDLFADEAGAEQDLSAYRREFRLTAAAAAAVGVGRLVRAPQLGEESAAYTQQQGIGAGAARYYTIAWRQGKLTSSVLVQGYEGRLRLGEVARLARAQERRIAEALG